MYRLLYRCILCYYICLHLVVYSLLLQYYSTSMIHTLSYLMLTFGRTAALLWGQVAGPFARSLALRGSRFLVCRSLGWELCRDAENTNPIYSTIAGRHGSVRAHACAHACMSVCVCIQIQAKSCISTSGYTWCSLYCVFVFRRYGYGGYESTNEHTHYVRPFVGVALSHVSCSFAELGAIPAAKEIQAASFVCC